MTNLDSIFKSRDIILPTKVCLVRAMVFPVVMYECESWAVKKAERFLPSPRLPIRPQLHLLPHPTSPEASEPMSALEKELADGPLPGATGQRSLPARSTPGQSGVDGNAVFVPASVPRVGPQQVPAKCLLVCSVNSQACIPPAPARPAGPVHTLACVFLCAWVCTCVRVHVNGNWCVCLRECTCVVWAYVCSMQGPGLSSTRVH